MRTLIFCLALLLAGCTIGDGGLRPLFSMGSSEQAFVERYGKPDFRSEEGGAIRLVYLGNRLDFRQRGDTPPLPVVEQKRMLARYGLAYDRSCAVLVSLMFGRVIGMTSIGGQCS
ncbi:hypothetical protein J8I29_04800 [Labrys sp. LIt4]|uniref:hypothetical protein n=1 Tax=Labrys TaxID=204476 RepID=UPI0011B2725D|nr:MULTISPECIES: hypothetical protein [Labrys]MBP0578619.1 hypothetical protein [Labrys sp. LIt4]